FSTTDAALRGKHHYWRWHLAFGVVSPEAAKRTPLEEDSGANARPVIHGKPQEVEQSTDGICRCRKLVRRVHDVQSRRECIISGTSPLAGARYRMVVSSDLCLIQCYTVRPSNPGRSLRVRPELHALRESLFTALRLSFS